MDTLFIEDEELRTLYRDASKEHLDQLESGVLHLEKQPDDSERLKQLLRHTHSLKGDSRMLGVNAVETLAHHIEDILSSIDREERRFTSTLCDRLCAAIDAIRQLAYEAVTGEPANISTFHVLAQLMDVGDASAEVANVAPSLDSSLSDYSASNFASLLESTVHLEQPDIEQWHHPTDDAQTAIDFDAIEDVDITDVMAALATSHASPPEEFVPPAEARSIQANEARETLRVEASKLDALVTQVGELVITKGRISQRINDIKTILVLLENWSRDAMLSPLMAQSRSSELGGNVSQHLQQTTKERLEKFSNRLNQLYDSANEDYSQLRTISDTLESNILKLRRLPLENLFNLFPRMVRDLSKQQNKAIELIVAGDDIQVDKRILEGMKDPLIHLVRNAIDHGVESPGERMTLGKPPTATLYLKAHQQGNKITIEVIDDGRGLDLENIQQTALTCGLRTSAELTAMGHEQIQNLIFAPGFSTRTSVTELSGRGVGLDVVRTSIEQLKGTIQVQSTPGQGCTFRFAFHNSLATTPALIVGSCANAYAIPLDTVDRIIRIKPPDIFLDQGEATITHQGQSVPIAWLRDLLQQPTSIAVQPEVSTSDDLCYCILLKVGSQQFGLVVDELLDQQDILLKPHSQLLRHVPNVAGVTILGSGNVAIVLNPSDLAKSLRSGDLSVVTVDQQTDTAPSRVLLVEDSMPIRTQIRRILENVGYEVTTAVDGLDGFNKLREGPAFDAVISDVEMPNLDGLSLITCIRRDLEDMTLPIILMTTLATDEDKRRGVEAGANAYLTKGNFDQAILIDTLKTLIN